MQCFVLALLCQEHTARQLVELRLVWSGELVLHHELTAAHTYHGHRCIARGACLLACGSEVGEARTLMRTAGLACSSSGDSAAGTAACWRLQAP